MNDCTKQEINNNVELLSLRDIEKKFKKSRDTIYRWRKLNSKGESFYYKVPFPKPVNEKEYSPRFDRKEVEDWYWNKLEKI